jgi:D-alanyl-D-alanine carboxypeptidase
LIIAAALSPALERLSAWFAAIRQERHLAGLSAAVVHDQEILWAHGVGYADVERQTLATAQTVYAMNSVTKLLTATMLMQVRDAGLVHLDDPLTRYVPAFQMRSIYRDPPAITLRQVASHLAGLPKDFPVPYFDNLEMPIPAIEHLLPSLPTAEVAFPPYTTTHYSNLGYALLGYALTQVVQQPYREYVHEHILRPLEMHSSGFGRRKGPEVATGYFPQNSDGSWRAAPVIEDGALEPAGGLYASVTDMARFLCLQCRVGPAQSSQILAGTTLREMHAPAWIDSKWEKGIGIGWRLRRFQQYTQISHSGDGPGFSAEVRLLPDLKVGLVLATNTDTDASSIAQAALELLVPAFAPQPYWVQVAAGEDSWRYTGQYRSSIANMELAIWLTADRLQGQFAGDESFTLIPEGGQRFRMDGGYLMGELLTFELDNQGHVSCIHFYGFSAHPWSPSRTNA